MKYLLCTILLVASVGATARNTAVMPVDQPLITPVNTTLASGLPARPAITPIFAQASISPAATLPYCGSYDGNACPVNGHRFRCMWAPYEPGLCFCSNNVWTCG